MVEVSNVLNVDDYIRAPELGCQPESLPIDQDWAARPLIRMLPQRRQYGFTLIESIIALVLLAAASTGVLLIYAEATSRSADPMLRAQAQSIAIGYMDEILLQSYADPETGATGAREEGSRPQYDDIWDYDTISDNPPADRTGNPIAALNDYAVNVAVTGGTPAIITVTVVHDTSKVNYDLVSEREDY